MKILKRNQLIVLVISLMLITAGYLNFTTNNENIAETTAKRTDTTIGDAELVSTIPHDEEENTIQNEIAVEKQEEQEENEINMETNTENAIETVETVTEDYYFSTSKLERNNMYSETLETYQEIYNNTNSTAEQKNEALKKINDINNTKNAIMITENLIIAKGFENVVVFSNEGSVSVVVKIEELKQEDVAQIQNIVSRELNVEAELIHISNK